MPTPPHTAVLIAKAIVEGDCSILEGRRWIGVTPERYAEIYNKTGAQSRAVKTVPMVGSRQVIEYHSENGEAYYVYRVGQVTDPVDTAWREKESESGVKRI